MTGGAMYGFGCGCVGELRSVRICGASNIIGKENGIIKEWGIRRRGDRFRRLARCRGVSQGLTGFRGVRLRGGVG